jgi:carbamoyl-phosphate synthase large subunit
MKSTGEVMGLALTVEGAFMKSQLAAGTKLPRSGEVFLSVKDDDKPALVDLARRLIALGFTLVATEGTRSYLERKQIPSRTVRKVKEGSPHIVDGIRTGDVAMLFNTTAGKVEIADSFSIRREALVRGVPYFTTVEAARMAVAALEAQALGARSYQSVQEYLGLPRRT